MSVYQGFLVLIIIFFICLGISFSKVKSKKRTIARFFSGIVVVAFIGLFVSFKSELSDLNKCNQIYQGFYVSDSLCYNSIDVTHDYLDGNGVKVASIMKLSEKSAVVKTADGRTLIVAKSADGFSLFPYL